MRPTVEASAQTREILGVLGGLGPLASAEFMRTIYECSLGKHEQNSPNVILLSDPAFPDRTTAILGGEEHLLIPPLTESLQRLVDQGAGKIVICCMTIHAVLQRAPESLRCRVVSLLDIIFDHVAANGGRHLIACTKGTRQMRLFESHAQWDATKDHFILPDEHDLETIHQMIYRLKSNSPPATEAPVLEKILEKYSASSFVSGCTEIHLLVKHYMSPAVSSTGYAFVDPLVIIARLVAQGLL